MVDHVFPWHRSNALSNQSQISAIISAATKDKLDRFTESQGIEKNFVVEQALLFFMEARCELSDEALVPVRIVLADDDFDWVVRMLDEPPAPTGELRELMRARRAGGPSAREGRRSERLLLRAA